MPLAQISLTLSCHFSLSFITSGRSLGLHPVSSHSCWMYVQAGHPAFARPYVGVHRSTSLMSSSLLLQQCPACLVRLTWIVFVMGGRWPKIKFSIYKQFYFKQFSTQFNSIWPIDRTLLAATTSGQSEPGSDGNEGVPHIPQSSSITGTSLSNCLVSYPGQQPTGKTTWGYKLM